MPDYSKRRKQIDSAVEGAVNGADTPKVDPRRAALKDKVARQKEGSARRKMAQRELDSYNRQHTDGSN